MLLHAVQKSVEVLMCMMILYAETMMEERNKRDAVLEASLREVLFQILQIVNDKKDHIPPVSNSNIVSFPYEITISRLVASFLYSYNHAQ